MAMEMRSNYTLVLRISHLTDSMPFRCELCFYNFPASCIHSPPCPQKMLHALEINKPTQKSATEGKASPAGAGREPAVGKLKLQSTHEHC